MDTFITIMGILIGVILIYLIAIIFLPIMRVRQQPIEISKTKSKGPSFRETVEFYVGGQKIVGWLYKPDKPGVLPCIIMSHGFGGTKDMALEKYALKFVSNGYAVLLYDYRYFGESEGQPRQLYSGVYQVEDLKAAIAYVRLRNDMDENRVVLWGTSAGASYGVIIAGEDHQIAGVIAQCGAFDHKEDSKSYIEQEGIGFFMKLFMHGQRDKGRSRFGLSPHVFPAYGKPGTTAMITAPGAFEGIARLANNSTLFKNEMCARLSLMPHPPSPVDLASTIACKVQIIVCEKDTLVSPKSHLRLVEILAGKTEVVSYPIGHFDLYFDDDFERATDDQLKFLATIL
jgi:hypothetical protein